MMWTTSRTILPGLLLVTIITDVQSDSQVSQDPELLITEDQDITLKCTHTITNSKFLIWYKQIPGLGLEICSYGVSSPTDLYSKYSMTMDKKSSTTQLHIKNVKGEDTAVYYCAVEDGGGTYKLIFGRGTQLTVQPKTDRTSPSVYQLTSYNPKESLPNTVCLLTDFPFSNDTLKVDEQPIDLNNKAALDKSSSDVWRYSAVIWDQNKNLNCAVKYNDGETILPDTIIDETTDTCSSLSVTERFHTNPSMNTLSTSVLGLRMLTAKAIVYNLIITLRLWSS